MSPGINLRTLFIYTLIISSEHFEPYIVYINILIDFIGLLK